MANVTEAFIVINDVLEDILFFETRFEEIFQIENISGNKTLKFVRCTFDKEVNLSKFSNKSILISKCEFKDRLIVRNVRTEGLEMEQNIFLSAEFINFDTDLILLNYNKIKGDIPLVFAQSQIKSLRVYQ